MKRAQSSKIQIGAAVRPANLSEPAYAATLAREFNMLEPEDALKWETLRPDPQTFDFHQADQLVDFALRHNMKVRGHTLVWHRQNPKWLTEGNYTPAELSKLLETHIKTVVGHYKGKIFAWDVANEAFDEGKRTGQPRSTIWSSLTDDKSRNSTSSPRLAHYSRLGTLAAQKLEARSCFTSPNVSAGRMKLIRKPCCSTTKPKPMK